MATVTLRSIEKSFGVTRVLKGVSLDIAAAEFISLVGPSGCGKTTLMRIIAGLERANAGGIEIDGRDVTAIRAADRDVAMVFQNYALYPHLTAYQNMAVPLVMRRLSSLERLPLIGRMVPGTGVRRRDIHTEIQDAAKLLGLDALLARKPAQLSGGQRQRVALGRAIVRHPKVFLMDEPLSNLDAGLRVATRREIVEIHRKVGAATVYVTHDQSEAMTMSDRVAVMMDGEILQLASPEEIYANPVDIKVATFIGSPQINRLGVKVGDDGMVRIDGMVTGLVTPHRGPATFGIRPEHIALTRGGIPVRIEHIEFLGESVLVHTRLLQSNAALVVRLPGTERQALAVGSTLGLAIDLDRAVLFDQNGKRAGLGRSDGAGAGTVRVLHG
jgi:multiple sugar transport system ATP-binding protein